jgi:hypothetical protein
VSNVKATKNVTDKIPLLGNIIHITDFAFIIVNEIIKMAKNKNTNWKDWARYCVGKVMDVLIFIPGVG